MNRALIPWAVLILAAMGGAAASLLVGAGNLDDEQLGGVFWADVLARCTPTQGELSLGVVTGFVGAPLFLYLLLRDSRRGAHS